MSRSTRRNHILCFIGSRHEIVTVVVGLCDRLLTTMNERYPRAGQRLVHRINNPPYELVALLEDFVKIRYPVTLGIGEIPPGWIEATIPRRHRNPNIVERIDRKRVVAEGVGCSLWNVILRYRRSNEWRTIERRYPAADRVRARGGTRRRGRGRPRR